jgi:hypothetical protein
MEIKSKFYPYQMTIQESYSDNPECNSREVILIFFKGEEDLFSINLNLDSFKVSKTTIYDKAIKADEIIDEFLNALDQVSRDEFNNNYKIAKSTVAEDIVHSISSKVKELALDGNCVSFAEVFTNLEQISISDDNNKVILIDDQYCMNPKCLCNETYLSFIEVDKEDRSGKEIFTLKFDLKKGKYETEFKACTDDYMGEIIKLFKSKQKTIHQVLKQRYKDMKIAGKHIYDEENIGLNANLEMPALSVKVGRNDKCPCGSGKKYKKCCGADIVL